MAKKNSCIRVLVLLLVVVILIIGCSTTTPIFYTDNPNKEFIILGEVTYRAGSGGRQGYIDFLAEAKRQYPETDYIIDVMVDGKITSFLWIFKSRSNIYRGTAIKYN